MGQLIFNYLVAPSLQILCLKDEGLNIVILCVFAPDNQKVPISIADPPLLSIYLIPFLYFGDSCVNVGCVRAYLILSKTPPFDLL